MCITRIGCAFGPVLCSGSSLAEASGVDSGSTGIWVGSAADSSLAAVVVSLVLISATGCWRAGSTLACVSTSVAFCAKRKKKQPG
eukprot:m.118893 g.118893  ORF g.118893 m.118893 type:complete len:85 (-) comp52026_c0_seq2:33-287(-)